MLPAPLVHSLGVIVSDLAIVKYINGAALTLLVYDHILCMPEELQFVWGARWSIAKTLFLFNRYLVPISLVLVAHAFAGFGTEGLTDTYCKTAMSLFSILGLFSISAADVVVVLRVIVLWNRRSPVTFSMLFVLFATLAVSIISMAMAISQMHATTTFNRLLKICVVSQRPTSLAMVWGSSLVFDIFVLLLTVLNYLDRPRTAHGGASMSVLYRDGIGFFLILSCLRAFTFVMALVAPLQFTHLGPFFAWPMVTLMLSRLIFNARKEEPSRCRQYDSEGQLTSGSSWEDDVG